MPENPKYIAKVVNAPNTERLIQSFGSSLEVLRDWARQTLKGTKQLSIVSNPLAEVEIYENKLELVEVIEQEKEKS